MKKIIYLTISLVILSYLQINLVSFAKGLKESAICYENGDCASGFICKQEGLDEKGNPKKFCRNLLDTLTQRPSNNVDAKAVKDLPSITLESGITVAIKTVLRSAFLMTIAAIVVAAIYYIISRGKEEDMTKAKDIILYLVIGMAIIAAAYGIVAGVTQFNVFG